MNLQDDVDNGWGGIHRRLRIALLSDVAGMPTETGEKYDTDLTFVSTKGWRSIYAIFDSVKYTETPSNTENGDVFSVQCIFNIRKEDIDKQAEFISYLKNPILLCYHHNNGYYKICGTKTEPLYLKYSINQGSVGDNYYSMEISGSVTHQPMIMTDSPTDM